MTDLEKLLLQIIELQTSDIILHQFGESRGESNRGQSSQYGQAQLARKYFRGFNEPNLGSLETDSPSRSFLPRTEEGAGAVIVIITRRD